MKANRSKTALLAVGTIGVLALSACGLGGEGGYAESGPKGSVVRPGDKQESVFGEGGLNIFNLGGGKKSAETGGAGIGVNSFLWRASLDTIKFMPLSSADPFGGVIITDWHTLPEAPAERFKMNVYILSRQLRADGIRVAVFRQSKNGNGRWDDSSVKPDTATNLENEILTRARQLRLGDVSR